MDRDETAGWQLPPDLERLWNVLEKDDRERSDRRGLSLRNIVVAGMDLADREGLAEVKMARIAGMLGFSTMALYRHVPSKSVLLVLMVDAAVGVPPSMPSGGGWRDRLEALASNLAILYRSHPWLLDVPISGPPATPNNVRWMEAGVSGFGDTSLPFADRLGIWMLLAAFVRGQSLFALQLERGTGAVEVRDTYAATLRRLIEPGGFPELTHAIEAGHFDGTAITKEDNDADFAFGLARVLDGIAVYLAGTPGNGVWNDHGGTPARRGQ